MHHAWRCCAGLPSVFLSLAGGATQRWPQPLRITPLGVGAFLGLARSASALSWPARPESQKISPVRRAGRVLSVLPDFMPFDPEPYICRTLLIAGTVAPFAGRRQSIHDRGCRQWRQWAGRPGRATGPARGRSTPVSGRLGRRPASPLWAKRGHVAAIEFGGSGPIAAIKHSFMTAGNRCNFPGERLVIQRHRRYLRRARAVKIDLRPFVVPPASVFCLGTRALGARRP
jgi:hypothetical protein